jgi:hypothetical protein
MLVSTIFDDLTGALSRGSIAPSAGVVALLREFDEEPDSERAWREIPVIGVVADVDGLDFITDLDGVSAQLDAAGLGSVLSALGPSALELDAFVRGQWVALGDDEQARIDLPVLRFVHDDAGALVGLMTKSER